MKSERIVVETLIGPDAVAGMFGVSKQTIARWWKAGMFPAPLRCGRRALRWRLSELNQWILRKENTNGLNSRIPEARNGADLPIGTGAAAADARP